MDLNNISTHFYEGQSGFIETIKRFLYKKDLSIFEKIDFYNEKIYLNPLLYSYFSMGKENINIKLEQILYSFLPNDSIVNVISDKDGIIYLPNYGYLLDIRANTKFIFSKNSKLLYLQDNIKESIPYRYEKVCTIQNNQIELCLYNNKYFDSIIRTWIDSDNILSEKDHKYLVNKHQNDIERAFEIIKNILPEFYELIIASTNKIFLYENKNIRSFVTRKCHGTIFFSVNDNSNITFFLEEILHQCAHNIFNAVTFDISKFLQISEKEKLGNLISNEDHRTIYDAFHGVFTVSTGTQSLYKICSKIDLENEDLNEELLARLAIKSNRFRTGIEKVDFDTVFTKKGKIIYDFLDKKCEQIINEHPDIFNKYNFYNQPHVFSYEEFKKVN